MTLTPEEIEQTEVADFGLSEIKISGAQIITLLDTHQFAAKILVLQPFQIELEQTLLAIGVYNRKAETIRYEWG